MTVCHVGDRIDGAAEPLDVILHAGKPWGTASTSGCFRYARPPRLQLAFVNLLKGRYGGEEAASGPLPRGCVQFHERLECVAEVPNKLGQLPQVVGVLICFHVIDAMAGSADPVCRHAGASVRLKRTGVRVKVVPTGHRSNSPLANRYHHFLITLQNGAAQGRDRQRPTRHYRESG